MLWDPWILTSLGGLTLLGAAWTMRRRRAERRMVARRLRTLRDH